MPSAAGFSRRTLFRGLAGSPLRAAANRRAPPNIVFLYTDDQAAWSLPAYGNPHAHTPNMDRIGREGVVFENSIVTTPVCSPSRGAMYTSRYAFELGIPDYIDRNQTDAGLPAEFPTWPEQLQRAGYKTALFGKWHLGTRPEFHPTRRGYDRFTGFLGGSSRPLDPVLEVDGTTKQVAGFLPDILTDEAIRFLRDNRNHRFLISLHFREPHLPYLPVPEADAKLFQAPLRDLPTYKGVDPQWLDVNRRDYYRAIASADRCIGRVLGELAAYSLDRNTLVILAGDNGYMIGQHGLNTKGNANWVSGERKGRHRPNMFEPSLGVPLLMRWPGVITAGRRVPQMVTNLDYCPTILEACRLPAPKGYQPRGRSLLDLAAGKTVQWRSAVYGDYQMINELQQYHESEDTMRMVRTRDWKLVTHSDPHYLDELYHLAEDPDEERNLIAEPSAERKREQLSGQLAAWQSHVNDPEGQRKRPPKREPYFN